MYTVDGFNITIPRGDSADLLFKLYDEDNQCPYILDDQQVRIDVFYETSLNLSYRFCSPRCDMNDSSDLNSR